MSDELDPNLLRLFEQAHQPLPGEEFQARVEARMHRSRGAAGWFGFAIRGALTGIVAGLIAPFKLRSGYVGVMAASAAALTVWFALQGP